LPSGVATPSAATISIIDTVTFFAAAGADNARSKLASPPEPAESVRLLPHAAITPRMIIAARLVMWGSQ
jgi:hypothetical protein